MPLISCIVPVFNGERYIGETLNSILNQTYRPLEVIVVDDGSTDGTHKIVGKYRNNVKYIRQPNSGPWHARNNGLRTAQGDFLAFQDADDLWHPEKLLRQMARFQKYPELDFCISHIQNFWIPELANEEKRFKDHRRSKPLPGYSTITLLARRSCFEKVGVFNTTLSHTGHAEWFTRAKDRNTVMELLPDVLAYRRIHHSNRSRLRATASRNEFLDFVKRSLDYRRHQKSSTDAHRKSPTSDQTES